MSKNSGMGDFLQNAYNEQKINIGDSISTEPGSDAHGAVGALNARISAGLAADPSGSAGSHTTGDMRVVELPTVEAVGNLNGTTQTTITGFVAFWLTSAVQVGNSAKISGVFINSAVADNTPNPNASTTGPFFAVLVK